MKRLMVFVMLVWMPGAYNNTPVVHNDQSLGSGFVLRKGFVMTAHHIFGPNLKVNGQDTEVVAMNPHNDLMLIKAPLKGKASFAEPKLDEEVVVIGYGLGVKMVLHGRVNVIKEDKTLFLIDATTPGGTSGSAVYNLDGYVVGMVQGGFGNEPGGTLTTCIHSRLLKEFAKATEKLK